MASDVHSDNRSRVVGSPRFHPGFASRCYGEPYAPGRRTKLRSGSATRHSLVSRQTLRALVSAPTDGLPFCAHSGCPKPSRLSPRETLAVRWSGEIPRLPRRSCGGPPVPPHARGEGRTPPAVARCLCAYSGRGVGPLANPHCVRLGESSAAAPFRPCRPRSRLEEDYSTGTRLGFFTSKSGSVLWHQVGPAR